jgi:diadenosine tetraphosphate (Ap4A) HIT family hydrolase
MSASVKALFETTSFVVGPADNFDVPGYLVIRPERTVSGFDELRPQELAEFGILQGACAAVLSEVLKPVKIYFLVFGESGIQLHQHVLPRTVELTNPILAGIRKRRL